MREGAQNGNGIGKKHQNETAHHCIERPAGPDLGHIGLSEAHITQSSLGDTGSSAPDGSCVAFYPHDLSGRTNQPGRQHGYVSDAGAEVQDTLPRTNTCLAEESFRAGSQTRSLPDEALVFEVRAAEDVIRGGSVEVMPVHSGRRHPLWRMPRPGRASRKPVRLLPALVLRLAGATPAPPI
jgi:hypothetical protein